MHRDPVVDLSGYWEAAVAEMVSGPGMLHKAAQTRIHDTHRALVRAAPIYPDGIVLKLIHAAGLVSSLPSPVCRSAAVQIDRIAQRLIRNEPKRRTHVDLSNILHRIKPAARQRDQMFRAAPFVFTTVGEDAVTELEILIEAIKELYHYGNIEPASDA
ncbi:hypothetical protein FHS85_000027 [Rhodoligotrophos appendicifer]|uniref:hypothetical protein n=1 Tax=Rhodoligotrophos appendicifer TaxID=987056 RepID=UPI00117D20BD|nr:hypothetical protein [Rhodoligotrophos appendicifer]